MTNLSEQEAEAIAKRAARETGEEILQKLGMDTENVREMQKDFAHLRQQRLASDQVGAWTRRILLGIFISSLVGTLVAGIKAGLNFKG
ncbi:hypothetical protein [uncultured Microbulbifer sp.]|uniref:hypothetical protein n=1 Tax=uncultured Microbulbifer sp. TaxID=348147 RepID=UPI002628481D|nr:hypothetical protein [uncultured Microbulbifer sp.]